MDHSEAVQQMAAERYLLDELTPDAREAFEEHAFDCPDCALDLRAAVAFVDEAKVQLPELAQRSVAPAPPASGKRRVKWDSWFSWARPAFAVPAFAALLIVVGYQNLVTLPGLRTEATQPRLLPWVSVHGATRGGAGTQISADRVHGVALPLDLSPQTGVDAYPSYSFDLLDPQGKLVWTGAMAAPAADGSGSQRVLLAIPGAVLRDGGYTVAVSGVGPHGERVPIEKYLFNLVVAGK
jgi:hypothetical protein